MTAMTSFPPGDQPPIQSSGPAKQSKTRRVQVATVAILLLIAIAVVLLLLL